MSQRHHLQIFFGFLIFFVMLAGWLSYSTLARQSDSPARVVATILTGLGVGLPRAIVINPNINRIYVVGATTNLSVIDSNKNQVINVIKLDGNTSGIAVNPITNRVYVSVSMPVSFRYKIVVIDGPSDTIVGEIPVPVPIANIAVQSATNRIYATNRDGDMIVINGETNQVEKIIQFTLPPDYDRAIAVNPVTNQIFIVDSGGGNVVVIDGATDSIIRTIPVGSQPGFIAINPMTNRIYICDFQSPKLSVIDGNTNMLLKQVPIGTSNADSQGSLREIAVDPTLNRIYVKDNLTSVLVVDGDTNQVTGMLQSGSGTARIGVQETTHQIYVVNEQQDTVSVFNHTNNLQITTFPVGSYQVAMGINPGTNQLYVVNQNTNSVAVVDATTNTLKKEIKVGIRPAGIGINPTTNRIYVSNGMEATVSVIDGLSDTVIKKVDVGFFPIGVGVNPNTNRIFVCNRHGNSVSVINGETNTVIETIPLPTNGPKAVAVNPNTNRIYVLHDLFITIIDFNDPNVKPLRIGTRGLSLTINPLTNRLYVADLSQVAVIDVNTLSTLDIIGIRNGPFAAIGVNPTTNHIFLTQFGFTVAEIDGNTNQVIANIRVGRFPASLVVNPSTNRIYVGNRLDDTVTVMTEEAPVDPDTQPPVVTNVRLSKSKIIRKKDAILDISWTSTDNIGVASHSLVFSAPDQNFVTEIASGLSAQVQSFTWRIPGIIPKSKTANIQVVARDEATNSGIGQSASFSVR